MNSRLKNEVEKIREFNRYYTKILGLLDQHFLESEFSFSEVRVLYEIYKTIPCTIKLLSQVLSMDTGYLSRIMKRFEKNGLVERKASSEDGRSHHLFLTSRGLEAIAVLNDRSDEQIFYMIQFLSKQDLSRLVRDMTSIKQVLSKLRDIKYEDITIRHKIQQGDIGYLIFMHGWIYAKEYNYTTAFEGYIAKCFYEFIEQYDGNKDRLWLAEYNGEIIGSIAIFGHGEKAQMRWFLLHPDFQGFGLGKRLMKEALEYCKEKHFKSVYLITTSDLDKAIGMYEKAGFVKVAETENHTWTDNLLELTYEMNLENNGSILVGGPHERNKSGTY